MTTELLSTNEAADYLGLHPTTLATWRTQGRGPRFVKVGSRNVRYRANEIERWLDENQRDSTAHA